jgi:hypothetical protein
MRMLRQHVLTVIGKGRHQRSRRSESQRGGLCTSSRVTYLSRSGTMVVEIIHSYYDYQIFSDKVYLASYAICLCIA